LAVTVEPAGQFVGEHDQRQLGLIVRSQSGAVFCRHQVVKVDRRLAVKVTGEVHHSRWGTGLEQIQQQVGQQERRRAVDHEDHLHGVYGHLPFARGHAGVVDQHVQVRVARPEFLC
jgi:hypothetical protein